jgi:NADH:ubiquinone oxidoreductase subunit 2 (subunit N)
MPIYNLNYNLEFLDFIFLSPEFFLIFATLTIFLTMLFSDSNKFLLPTHEVSTEQQKTVIPTNVSFSFSLALTIISVFFVNVIYFNSYSIMYTNYTVFNNFFYGYFFIFFFKIFLTFIFFCYLIAVSNFSDQEFGFEFNFLLSIGFFSMQLFLSSCNLVSLYICLELQSFCFYIMAAYRKNSIFSSEAGLKFFILNSFSSVLILFGISAIYSVYGTFDLDIISSFLLFFCL